MVPVPSLDKKHPPLLFKFTLFSLPQRLPSTLCRFPNLLDDGRLFFVRIPYLCKRNVLNRNYRPTGRLVISKFQKICQEKNLSHRNASLKRGKTFGEERTRYGNIVSPSTEADQGNLWFFKDVPTFQDESLGKSRLKGSREGFFASWSRMVLKAEAASVLVCFFRVWRVVIKMPRV
jgi:hypothetical protein